MNSPGIQSLMQQITSNPEALQSMMSPENMQMMQRMMSQNPGLMQQVSVLLKLRTLQNPLVDDATRLVAVRWQSSALPTVPRYDASRSANGQC